MPRIRDLTGDPRNLQRALTAVRRGDREDERSMAPHTQEAAQLVHVKRKRKRKNKRKVYSQKQSGFAMARRTRERPQNKQELDRAELRENGIMQGRSCENVRTDSPERSRCPPRVEQYVSARASKMRRPGTAHRSRVHETIFACSISSSSHSCLVIVDVA
jgi:hypothetical protein